MKSVLTIAGSDPGGGAGIQADLRVIEALGLPGLSAITAITVQNSQGVKSVHLVASDILAAQIEAVMEDATELGAVKIGMLGGADQVRVVAEMIRRFRPPNVVLDPVLASSGGVPLLDDEGRAALLTELMPLCTVVTPNVPEAAILTGLPQAYDLASLAGTARQLFALGAQRVVLKGGHMPFSQGTDYLYFPSQLEPQIFRRVTLPNLDVHGTGCFLASGIAAHLANHRSLPDAIDETKETLVRAVQIPTLTGRGRGYPDVFAALNGVTSRHSERLRKLHGLYFVTDSDLRPDRSIEETVVAALAGGARIIQLRAKGVSTPELVELAWRLRFLAHQARALFIVNDRVDVALAAQADGVHLGPEDMQPHFARQLLGRDRLVGVSVASVAEAKRLVGTASYLGVGAVFGSTTKSDAGDAIGTERLCEIKTAFPDTPIVAIGGINLSNIDSVIAAGADAAAVISAVVCAPDIEKATAELVGRFPA